jgi:hypothetical protein
MLSTQPTASQVLDKMSQDFVGRLWVAWAHLSSDSVHTVLVAALMMYGISQEFEFTTEAALVLFNMQELRCCRTWKVYVTGTRRTSHSSTFIRSSKRDESHVRYESG